MRVLHILSSLHLGGAERFTIDLSKIQKEKGLDAGILSLGTENETLVPEVHNHNIPLSFCSKNNSRLQRYKIINALFSKSDVIHIHSPYALRFLAVLIMLHPSKTYIYTRHGLATLNTLSWKCVHQVLRPFINFVTFVTSSGRDVFEKNQRWDKNRLIVIENGVYIPEPPTPNTLPPVRFGSVCRMVALKGQLFLLDALQEVEKIMEDKADSSYELHFFGTGPMEHDLKSKSSTFKYPASIQYHGNVLDREAIYRNIDVLIVSSETEGLSMVIMEAMARKVCVIATEVGGNPTLVKPGDNGELIPYGDTAALAQKIIKLINEKQTRLTYGENAREFIIQSYSLDNTQKQFFKYYSS